MPFEVMEQSCDQCLFTENRIVSKKRFGQIIKDCRRDDKHFRCHKATIEERDVCCHSFFDTQPPTQLMRIAERLNMVRFVKQEDL